jgi:hypothetical protein
MLIFPVSWSANAASIFYFLAMRNLFVILSRWGGVAPCFPKKRKARYTFSKGYISQAETVHEESK